MDTTVNVAPSAERDLGRVEGKMDILLAAVARMEQASSTSNELTAQRFVKVDERLNRIRQEAADDRKRIDNRITALRTHILVAAASLGGAVAAATGSLKTVVSAVLHMAF